jgi:hypothetical protein
MLKKLPEQFVYEYVVNFEGDEIAVYFSDAIPPDIGSLLSPWEFVSPEIKNQKNLHYMGPYRVIEVNQQPKNLDGKVGVSSQTLVNIVVEK